MTETQFIEKNKLFWEELEAILDKPVKDADKLSGLFVKVSSDLSYARTFYPNRSVRLYLNNLTQRVFDSMQTDEDKFEFKQITNFFRHILPQEIYNSRKALLSSLAIFLIALGIGIISSKYNPDFPKIILGNEYIKMTEKNIADGDPMAVYKDDRKLNMFFGITTNNIRVALLAFVLGIIGAVGTVIVLLSNGIMVGAFQYFFLTKGLFWVSFLTIWIHGTIEISAIIIAGGAGIVMGNGLLFPKTYDRNTSLQIAALRALRIILGTVPLFIIAGLLESFVTRQTELPTFIKVTIIGLSALLIFIMWIAYPWYYHKKGFDKELSYNITPEHKSLRSISTKSYKSLSKIISDALFEFRMLVGKNFSHAIMPTLLFLAVTAFVQLKISTYDSDSITLLETYGLSKLNVGSLGMSTIYLVLISYAFCMFSFTINQEDHTLSNKLKFLKSNYIQVLAVTALMFIPFTIINSYLWMFFWILFSPHFYVIAIETITSQQNSLWSNFKSAFTTGFNSWFKFAPFYLLAMFLFWLIMLLQSSPIIGLVVDFLSWHRLYDISSKNVAFVNAIVSWFLMLLFVPAVYYFFRNQYYSMTTEQNAIDLNEKLKLFGQSNSVFENQ